MKLLIAIPTMESVPVEFMRSLLQLQSRLLRDGVDFDIEIESGTLVYRARDRLASKAVNGGYDWMLCLDSDMVFTDEVLYDLQFCGKDFVTGIAHSRRRPFGSCIFTDLDLDHLRTWEGQYPTSSFEIAGCGMACVLVKTEIVKSVMLHYGTAFEPLKNYGEDLSFCKRAHDLGYRLYAEPSVRLGHIAHIPIYPDDAERYRDNYMEG